MLKNATYKEKFEMLRPWLLQIVDEIKKDLKNDHLRSDPGFCKQYLVGKHYQKATAPELAEAYAKALETSENSESLAEFITNRWLLKHTDVYDFFEKALTKISPNFTDLEEIPQAQAETMAKASSKEFGALPTYLFAVLNSVVFPRAIYSHLEKQSKEEAEHAAHTEKTEAEEKEHKDLKTYFEQQIARLTDKYEKKLQGLQKKYQVDTEQLKKQLALLQKKMSQK